LKLIGENDQTGVKRMNDLPVGWLEERLEELCSFNPRHDSLTDRKQEVSFVPMSAVCENQGIILDHEARLLEDVWRGYTHFQNNDVIFAKITPCMENGKIALASKLFNGLACGSTEFHVLRSLGAILPQYLWQFIRQLDTAFTSNDWYVRSQMITKLLVGGHCLPYSPLYLLSEVRAVSEKKLNDI
jgi:hypothetical protein